MRPIKGPAYLSGVVRIRPTGSDIQTLAFQLVVLFGEVGESLEGRFLLEHFTESGL